MKNTLDYREYIKEHVIWSLLVFLWFRSLMFRCIPDYTYTESLVGFLIISVCVMAVGITVSWKRNRNYTNVIENILLFIPYGFISAWAFKWGRKLIPCAAFGFFSSVVIECVQYATKRGYFQIDDILTNLLGSVIGYFVFRLLRR